MKITVVVAYTFDVKDEKAAHVLVDVIKNRDDATFSENYTIFDFNPDERLVSVETAKD